MLFVLWLFWLLPACVSESVAATNSQPPTGITSVAPPAQTPVLSAPAVAKTDLPAPPAKPVRYEVEEKIFPFGKGVQRALVQGNPDAPSVLLMHGATFRAEVWRDLGTLQKLSDAGFYAVSVDLPRHGKTTSSGYSVETHLKKLIEALPLSRPVVLGHSYSGAFVLPVVALNPELLSGAVVADIVKVTTWESRLRASSLPVLILWGERDDLIPVYWATRLERALPNSRKVIFKTAGHECYNDAPDSFHDELLAFLRSLSK